MDHYIDFNVKQSGAALEDGIMRKGEPAAAGSKILDGFISPFDAEAVARLTENGIKIAGRTRMDEFGVPDLSGAAIGAPDAVKAVTNGAASYALCNDIFGTYRREAAKSGVCYIHPTYGTVSRYGLIPLAPSMDQIGVVCKNLTDGFGLLSAIAGKDDKDGAMFPDKKYEYKKTSKKIKLGIPSTVVALANEKDRKNIADLVSKFETVEIKLEYFDLYKQVMYILSSAEISSNLTRYDGIKFGYRARDYKNVDDLYVNTRTEAFGADAKLISIVGAMVLSTQYYFPLYDKAMRLRNMIKKSLHFNEYDAIILPAEIKGGAYDNLSLYALAQLAGLPSVSFGYNGSGVQLVAGALGENTLFTAWEAACL